MTGNHENDALYVRLDEKTTVAESEEVEPGVVLDFDGARHLVAIESTSVSEHVATSALAQLWFETV